MNCTICNKPVVLVPSAAERAAKHGGKQGERPGRGGKMNLDDVIRIEDALWCMATQPTMSRNDFVSCVKQTPENIAINQKAWDDAMDLIRSLGTRRKAMNHIEREIESARNEYFPA